MPEALLYVTDRPALIGVGILGLFVLALFVLVRGRPERWPAHITSKPLLTGNEAEFLYRLQRALPSYHVFPQVSFAAFITDTGRLTSNARWSIRAKFDRKIADYVICDRDLRVLALVELDDRTHVASADRQRDAITKAAGFQTIRFQSRRKPSEAEIADLFRHAQAWNAS